jgi:hypothetical protein
MSAWRTSADSGGNGCVEVRFVDGRVGVRDSKYPLGPVLWFTPAEWEAFVAGAKAGEFDRPASARAEP